MTAPRPKRKPVGLRKTGLSPEEKHQMPTGFAFFGDGYGRTNPDRERMQADWEQYRDDLLAEWIQKHPGTRPFAWWLFDSPERRRTADGSVHPFDNPERIAHVEECRLLYPNSPMDAYRLRYGRPSTHVGFGDGLVRYESEADYLSRLDLLLPGEAELIADGQ